MATNEDARVRYKYDMQIVHGDRRLGDHGTWMRRCPHKGRKGGLCPHLGTGIGPKLTKYGNKKLDAR